MDERLTQFLDAEERRLRTPPAFFRLRYFGLTPPARDGAKSDGTSAGELSLLNHEEKAGPGE